MKQFKNTQCVMLPTKNRTDIIINNSFSNKSLLQFRPDLKDASDKLRSALINQYLYIISNDKIECGDWFLTTSGNAYRCIKSNSVTIYYYKGNDRCSHAMKLEGCKKLIASSDEELNKGKVKSESLPQISQQFIEQYIEAYNRGEVITEVLVEYELDNINSILCQGECGICDDSCNIVFKVKVNQDNTINIKPVKDSWNREEHIKNMKKYLDENGREIEHGDIFDIGQTVNGVSTFMISLIDDKLDVFYYIDNSICLPYEYDKEDILKHIENLFGFEDIKFISNLYK